MTALAEISLSTGRQSAVLVLLVTLLTLPSLPARELMPTDEPRFALVARQMVEDPAPIVPHLGYDALTKQGEVYSDKPPVFFWLISFFSFFTGGVNEMSARLPSFFAAIAVVLLTRKIGVLLVDEGTGFMAGLVLATMSQFFQRAFWCSIDMVLTAFVLAAALCWLCAARPRPAIPALDTSGLPGTSSTSGRRRTLGLSALGGFFAAAATLSKGPVGLIFPLAFLAGDRIAARFGERSRHVAPVAPAAPAALAALAAVAAVVAFSLPVGAWMVAAFLTGGPGYLVEILFKQNVTRYVAAWNNIAPWYYYLYRLPLGLFPWTLMLPGAILAAWGRSLDRANERGPRADIVRGGQGNLPGGPDIVRGGQGNLPGGPDIVRGGQDIARGVQGNLRGLLLACGALVLFFSASTGKRGVYLLPLYPALAIAIAVAWRRLPSHADGAGQPPPRQHGEPRERHEPGPVPRGSRTIAILAWVHVGGLCLGGLAAIVLLPLMARQKAPDLVPQIQVLAVLMAATGLLSAFLFFRKQPFASFASVVGGVAVMTAVGSYLLVPGINQRAGVRAFGPQLAAIVGPDDVLVVDAEGYEQILFYSGLRGTRRDFNETRIVTAEDGSVILHSKAGRSGRGTDRSARSEVAPRDRADAQDRRDSLTRESVMTREPHLQGTSPPETERARRHVQLPPGARVVFVVKGPNVERVRSALGPSSRVLLATALYENPYYVVANRGAKHGR